MVAVIHHGATDRYLLARNMVSSRTVCTGTIVLTSQTSQFSLLSLNKLCPMSDKAQSRTDSATHKQTKPELRKQSTPINKHTLTAYSLIQRIRASTPINSDAAPSCPTGYRICYQSL